MRSLALTRSLELAAVRVEKKRHRDHPENESRQAQADDEDTRYRIH